MDLTRLLAPRSVAVVGASERAGSYGAETLRNLGVVGFRGDVWPVNPRRERVGARACFPSLTALPGVPDAVVIAIPAADVPAVVEQAGALGAGGAVVYAAGFAEAGGAALEAELRAAALRHDLPVCGPNCDGLVALHARAALWGDALAPLEAGPVALVSQSGNFVVNALATRRGLRLHTAVSSGNEAVVGTPDYVEHLAAQPEVGAIALLLEDAGDGARLCEALAACADAGVGVAVLKVGASAVGAAAAAAHTGAIAGDHRVFRALVEEAGAAWAEDAHDLLELAKALAVRRPQPRDGGLAILTCSGGDSGLSADEAERRGVELPALAPGTAAALRERLPPQATVANPLDYTAVVWGDRAALADMVAAVGADRAVGQVLVLYDQMPDLAGAAVERWAAVRAGILDGAHDSPAPVLVASTLPELLDDAAAWGFAEAGVPAVAGLRTAIACAAALAGRAPDGDRLRELARAARAPGAGAGRWLAEHEAKALLRAGGASVVAGRLAAGEDDAVAALAELGGDVALKLSSPALRHKTAAGALALGLRDEDDVRRAWRRLAALDGDASVLVEAMAPPGDELIFAVRRDAVVPALVVGLGGTWAEVLDDVAIVPLPAGPGRVERALRSLRGAPLLRGDLAAAAEVAACLGTLALEHGLELLEANPVLVHRAGAVVVDAVAKESP
jgi:acetyl-CoA synthetase